MKKLPKLPATYKASIKLGAKIKADPIALQNFINFCIQGIRMKHDPDNKIIGKIEYLEHDSKNKKMSFRVYPKEDT